MPDPQTNPHEETQDLSGLVAPKGRKHWFHSWKVRCCWIADIWPVSAGAMQLLGQWQRGESLHVDPVTVWQAMLPWLLLAFNELAADLVKVWHEWKSGKRE